MNIRRIASTFRKVFEFQRSIQRFHVEIYLEKAFYFTAYAKIKITKVRFFPITKFFFLTYFYDRYIALTAKAIFNFHQ